MRINLAGYNIDTDVLEEMKQAFPQRQDATPETLSAAYARISRDPREIDELRKDSRREVEKARKSNSSIIFKMGHHSVAEHAVFNFDIIGISRLAAEALEHFRLASFTEKSQRYIKLENDFVIPDEIKGTSVEGSFINAVKEQNALYHKLKEKTLPEDARYITSLATQAQLGLTVNARNLELIFRRFASQPLAEVKELSKKMFDLAAEIAPSIILFTEENDFDGKSYDEIKFEIRNSKFEINSKFQMQNSIQEVKPVDFTKDADDILVTSLLFAVSGEGYEGCREKVKRMTAEEKAAVVKASVKYMQFYDTVLREFENIDLTFEVVLSAACFAQLKRHRMATIIAQPYDIALGVTVPPSIKEIGMEKEFMEVIGRTEDVYEKISKVSGLAAPYVLTNSHRRRVLFKCNARELYHVSRLREDAHAQWDIRNISKKMSEEAKKVMPLAMLLIGGKDAYPEVYRKIFEKCPKM